MLVILLIWIFLLVLSIPWSVGLCKALLNGNPEYEKSLTDIHYGYHSLIGLLIMGSVASIITSFQFSAYTAFYCILALTLALFLDIKRPLFQVYQAALAEFRSFGWITWAYILFFFTAFWITSAGPSEIGDEGGYHLPIMVMLEQYGVVLGVGNLNHHIPLCSTWHVLEATLGFGFLFSKPGHGFYDLTGYSAVLFVLLAAHYVQVLVSSKTFNKQNYFALIAATLPILIIKAPITAPTNDIPAWIYTWAGAIFFLQFQNRMVGAYKYIPILLFGGMIGVKVTHAPMIIVPLFLLFYALRKKEYGYLAASIVLLLFLNLPTVIRSIQMSGYLLYPVVGKQNMFHLAWHVPAFWAKNANNATHYFLPEDINKFSKEWVTYWFTKYYNKGEAVLVALAALASLALSIFALLKLPKRQPTHLELIMIAALGSLFVLFFFGSPEPRYGLGYIGISALGVTLWLLSGLPFSKMLWAPALAFVILFGAYKLYSAAKGHTLLAYALVPSRVETTYQAENMGGQAYYKTTSCTGYTNPQNRPTCDCWNTPFPCSEELQALPPLLNKTPAGGFKTRVDE
jgi:hypothetical protein